MSKDLSQLYATHVEVLRSRFDRALEETGYDGVLIYSGSLTMRFLDDNPYPFYANPHFRTWIPVNEPECFVFYEAGGKPRVVFHQPVDYWHKAPETPTDFWVDEVELHIVTSEDQSRETIETFLGKERKIAFLGEWQDRFEAWVSAEINPNALLERLHFERSWKTDYEVECISRANDIAARGHVAARDAFLAGASEY
ncbi:MAG: Xaa-Pro dipeptidase, partial [Thermoanaerobaculia bacterium]|nr:Xaa-Pro dipeptidase [Thermoanaerobaculia bacterium]